MYMFTCMCVCVCKYIHICTYVCVFCVADVPVCVCIHVCYSQGAAGDSWSSTASPSPSKLFCPNFRYLLNIVLGALCVDWSIMLAILIQDKEVLKEIAGKVVEYFQATTAQGGASVVSHLVPLLDDFQHWTLEHWWGGGGGRGGEGGGGRGRGGMSSDLWVAIWLELGARSETPGSAEMLSCSWVLCVVVCTVGRWRDCRGVSECAQLNKVAYEMALAWSVNASLSINQLKMAITSSYVDNWEQMCSVRACVITPESHQL